MMRYKTIIVKDLEQVETLLNVVVNGMNNHTIDVGDMYNKVNQALGHLRNALEKVSLEPDQTS